MSNSNPQPMEAFLDEALDDFGHAVINAKANGDISRTELVSVAKQQILAKHQAIVEELKEVSEYQIGISLCNEKHGIWGLCIAKEGKQVYGQIYKSKEDAEADIPNVLATLKQMLQPPQAKEDA